jgi:Spy/CpxP family protein refolding chaperone
VSKMTPKFVPYALALSLTMITFSTALADNSTMSNAAAPPAWQLYFRTHSLDFPQVFRSHHPGPGWILSHNAQLNLTGAQMTIEKQLMLGMVTATRSDVGALQVAYAKYQADAALKEPSLQLITADVDAVGKAQTRLGLAMVPFHLKAYAALTPAQKVTYQMLVSSAPGG